MAVEGASLSIDKVTVAYGQAAVLHGVSLEVGPGEFVALLGSSGCGKTTLLRAISGFARVAGGSIRVAGRDITELPPDRRDMAMVFQSYALWPHMTAAQNVGYGLKLRGVARAERRGRVDALLEMLGLAGLGDRPVTQLSGGQRQRVALGRALAVNPRILLLDEPLSNLDARIRQTVRHEIKALQSRLGITAVHVTHDREEAMVMADRIAIMDAGRVAQFGAPEEVYNRPASAFVAMFMGADNAIDLDTRPADGRLTIEACAENESAMLGVGDGGAHCPAPAAGRMRAHFRSEAARILLDQEPAADALVLRGRIVQSSYPGGFYRYGVDVGPHHFMVDDQRRLAVGTAVRIAVPAAALAIFPAGRA